jgi:hypothetical protein
VRELTHPAFRDVYMAVRKSFYVQEKNIWKLKVIWMKRKHGYEICEEKLTLSAEKYREFKPYGGGA